MSHTSPSVSLLLTGNELMSGDIVDSNSAMLAELLDEVGISVGYKATVGDDLELLASEIKRIAAFSDFLVVNGGLGPTVDDLTAEALAKVLAVPLEENSLALTQLREWCEQKNMALNDANRKQAFLPKGVEVIENPIGSAPGFMATINGCEVFCTPGVPPELKRMFEDSIMPRIAKGKPSGGKRVRLRVFGMGESGIQQRLIKNKVKLPEGIELGFRASLPMLELKFQAREAQYFDNLDQAVALAKNLFGSHIVTDDERSIAKVVQDLLIEKGARVTFAESCTGGLISASMTELAGASQVFDAGFVTYSNAMKTEMLDVSPETLAKHGAVSEEVVREMLNGALKRSQADLGVAVSGIAGPDGGSEDKPVGTVWLAWGGAEKNYARCFYFPFDRVRFQIVVAALAMDLIRRELLVEAEEPVYFKERRLREAPGD